jgi:hypothetical protein
MLNPTPVAGRAAVLLITAVLATVTASAYLSGVRASAAEAQSSCQVTTPNGSTPSGERPSPRHHGDDNLWTQLWPEGTVVFRPGGPGFVLPDGSLQMKFPWWRGVQGRLIIEGRRLDADAPALRAHIPNGYGASGFQATGLIFPTPGCWEVTGHAGEATLSFVVSVVKIGEGPVQHRLP